MDSEGKVLAEDYAVWLRHATNFYLKLNDDQKNEALTSLISVSGPNQLVSLTDVLPSLLFRDFVAHLPSELLFAILRHLDGQDLLSCCQVSKYWRDCIGNLVDLWNYKARELGVIIPTKLPSDVNSSHPPSVPAYDASSNCLSYDGDEDGTSVELIQLQEKSKLYKRLFFKTFKLIAGFRNGTSLTFNNNFVHTGMRRINSLMFHNNCLLIGSDSQLQWRSVPDGKLVSTISTHSVCDMTVKHDTLYTASFNATVESWDSTSGGKKLTFYGHTAAVLSVDVSEDGNFVLTGSVDRTVKVWDQRTNVDLMTTLSDVHRDWVFKVKFISCQSDSLKFISVDSTLIQMWTFQLNTRHLQSNATHVDTGKEFISVVYKQSLSSKIFASTWSEARSLSEFLTFEIAGNKLTLLDQWHFSSKSKSKASILAVGARFMLTTCAITTDFFILDLRRKYCLAWITTPGCLISRTKSTVAVCDTSWLDGFDHDLIKAGVPFLATCIDRHTVLLCSWNTAQKQRTEKGSLIIDGL